MNDRSQLYFECHITIDPCSGDRLAALKTIAENMGFRVADLYMIKDDTPNTRDCFLSARDQSYSCMMKRMLHVMNEFRFASIKIRRYKIEDTIIDSNKNDVLGLLDVKKTS